MAKDPTDRMLFVNLPVQDLERSKAFFATLGFSFDPRLSDQSAACMIINDKASVMLLTRPFFQRFTKRELADTAQQTEGIFALSCASREEVDELVHRALESGGSPAMPPMTEHEFMYGWSFYDPDGHHWEVMWMQAPPAE